MSKLLQQINSFHHPKRNSLNIVNESGISNLAHPIRDHRSQSTQQKDLQQSRKKQTKTVTMDPPQSIQQDANLEETFKNQSQSKEIQLLLETINKLQNQLNQLEEKNRIVLNDSKENENHNLTVISSQPESQLVSEKNLAELSKKYDELSRISQGQKKKISNYEYLIKSLNKKIDQLKVDINEMLIENEKLSNLLEIQEKKWELEKGEIKRRTTRETEKEARVQSNKLKEEVAEHIKKIELENKSLKECLKEAEKEKTEKSSAIEQLKKANLNLEQSLKALSQSKNKSEYNERQVIELKAQVDHKSQQLNQVNSEKSYLNQEIQSIRRQLQTFSESWAQESVKWDNERRMLYSRLNSLIESIQEQQSQGMMAEFNDKELRKLKAQIGDLEQENKNLLIRNLGEVEKHSDLEGLQASLVEMQGENGQLRATVQELHREISSKDSQLMEMSFAVQKLCAERNQFQGQLLELKSKYDEVRVCLQNSMHEVRMLKSAQH